MMQVLQNLLSNAIKYSPKGGDIHVHMNVVTRDAESFQRPHNQAAIFGDLHRELEKARRRG